MQHIKSRSNFKNKAPTSGDGQDVPAGYLVPHGKATAASHQVPLLLVLEPQNHAVGTCTGPHIPNQVMLFPQDEIGILQSNREHARDRNGVR